MIRKFLLPVLIGHLLFVGMIYFGSNGFHLEKFEKFTFSNELSQHDLFQIQSAAPVNDFAFYSSKEEINLSPQRDFRKLSSNTLAVVSVLVSIHTAIDNVREINFYRSFSRSCSEVKTFLLFRSILI